MQFSTWQEFFHMGGYALYVWVSYTLAVAVLGAVLLSPLLRHRHLRRELARRERLAERNRNQETP